MLQRFLSNHVFANVTFGVILIVGALSFFMLPRSQDPEINFNWINVTTAFPGASAEEVEKLITDPLEEALRKVDDIDFVSSTSREGHSNILIRFDDISDRQFDKRLNDLRRELQSKANAALPNDIEDPIILEVTTANAFPTAIVVVRGQANDENLRRTALLVKEDIERIPGVGNVVTSGLNDPELHIEFSPMALQARQVTPVQLADSIRAHFTDLAAGNMRLGEEEWLVRLIGKVSDPAHIQQIPLLGATGLVHVGDVANVSQGMEFPRVLVKQSGQAAVMLAINKKAYTNTLTLVDAVQQYVADKNPLLAPLGVTVVLLDDQTIPTRQAIDVMQINAMLGLILVALMTWIFLGAHIALLIGIGIPFTLAGTFWVLSLVGETLNQSVLLAVVIVLGMLVDDAVVVVEAIYYRIQRGMQAMQATLAGLKEVFQPVLASVLTTIAAFLPLMLLPGILGDFMFVIPFVVSVALAISLLEAFWILPVHVSAFDVRVNDNSRLQRRRKRVTRWIRLTYSRLLIKSFRRPIVTLSIIVLFVSGAIGLLASGKVKTEFFAFDPLRLFYINIVMPPGTPVDTTLKFVSSIEAKVQRQVKPGEVREMVFAAGQMFTEMAPFFGARYGQVIVSLNPKTETVRSVKDMVETMRESIESTPGAANISFLMMSGGPPVSKPISVKVRGDNYAEIRLATNALREFLQQQPAVSDINDDDTPGKPELVLRLDWDAIKTQDLPVSDVIRAMRLLFDGEIVATMQHEGRKLDILVRSQFTRYDSIDTLKRYTLALPSGGSVTLGQLMRVDTSTSKDNIRHYNFRRTITIEANLDKTVQDTVAVNEVLMAYWDTIKMQYPHINLDFSGELDDIEESLGAMGVLFLFGIGLIYLIIGTQFRSYFQPFIVLVTVPLAFTGVVYGLVVSGHPLSLYTLYGVVALAGIAVNAAIVMIDAANVRLAQGMSVLHATLYAARRRVIPIIITSLTTIAGLFSLATGLGGASLLWGPVAAAIVWGLAFSTILTLFVIPALFNLFMRRSRRYHHLTITSGRQKHNTDAVGN